MKACYLSLAIGIVVVVSSVFCAPSPTCDLGLETFNCMYKTNYSMDGDNNYDYFISNEEKLDAMCRKELPLVKCVAEVVTACETHPKTPLMEIYPGAYALMEKICDRGNDFRKKYLEQSKCLNSKKDQYEDLCNRAFMNMVEWPDKEGCKIFWNVTKKCDQNILKACGDEALNVAKVLFGPYRKPYYRVCQDSQ